MWSEVFSNGYINIWQHVGVFILIFEFLLTCHEAHCVLVYSPCDEIRRWLDSGSPDLSLRLAAPCWASHWHSCCLLTVRTLRLSRLSSPCSLTSNLAASGLNPILKLQSHDLGSLHLINLQDPLFAFWGIILWWRVSSLGISIFAYFASKSISLCSRASGSTSGSS